MLTKLEQNKGSVSPQRLSSIFRSAVTRKRSQAGTQMPGPVDAWDPLDQGPKVLAKTREIPRGSSCWAWASNLDPCGKATSHQMDK